ncbi:MAG TPA: peptidylprolyl isomerase [Terracidiphilus sp.]|nr:peptidylprolyl isomerase [Terracidiphilus sp.]
MIRFLQKDNRLTKALFVVIIAAASVSMVVYLIPGLTGGGATSADTFAVVYPHWYSRFLSSGEVVTEQRVQTMARQQIQQRNPQYADNPMIMNFFTKQVGEQLVQQQILLAEADRLGIGATNDDVANYLHSGPTGAVIFPNGKFIGDQQYTALVNTRLNISVAEFEENIKRDIVLQRLRAMVTASISVSGQEVRDTYRKENTRIKFDYAVIASDDLRKTINPADDSLEAYFKKNAARYANAVPEQRKISYFAFTPSQLPGGIPQASQQDIQSYYSAHQAEYQSPETATSRHILIKLAPNADPKADAAAKAKAEDVLKQVQNGGNFADLAKKYSDDPGSKDSGGELGPSQRGRMVPEFDSAIFTQKIGDTKVVKSQFGYHIVQVESRQPAHLQALNEVLPNIQATLSRDKISQAEESFAKQLTSEAIKNGLEKTAAAHHLEAVTTPPVAATGVISALPDGSQLLSKAFQSKVGDPAQYAPTGEGYAIFQVTGIDAAHAPTFADWKTHVLDDYRNEQLPALLNQKTRELADKAQASKDLAKAAKQVGATVKTSDLVGQSAQVPELGQVEQVAPQLFDMQLGGISGPINAGRTGVVAKLVDKQQPTDAEIQKNFDQQRDQILDQRRNEAFQLFASNVVNDYHKSNRVRINTKAQTPDTGE